MEKYKILILLNLILRIPLLFIIPISMFGDGIGRYIPYSFQILNLQFLFSEPPLLLMFWAGLNLFFSGAILELFWKLVPFLFFIGFLFLLPPIYKILKLKDNEKLIITALLIFSTPSLLYGESLMMEMTVLFFTFLLFLLIEKAKIINLKYCFAIAVATALMLYTKQTGFFIFAGFFIYTFMKNIPKKNKFLIILSLSLGFLFFTPWIIKNFLLSTSPSPFTSIPMKEFVLISLKNFFQGSKLDLINKTYHASWFIPLFEQIKSIRFIKILVLPYFTYYFLFLISAFLISIAIIAGIIKFGRKYEMYLFLISPLLVFVIFWGFFLGNYHDSWRYIFNLHLFFYFFAAKFIESIKKERIKKFFYIMIILFVLLSLMTAYATAFRMKNKDNQIREISNIVKENDFRVLSNEGYVTVSLKFYSKKTIEKVIFVDGELKNIENKIFESRDYEVFLKENLYYVHKK